MMVFKSFSLIKRAYFHSGSLLSLALESTWVSLSLSILQTNYPYYNKIIIIKLRKKMYITLRKICIWVFFYYLFLFSKIFMSKYNIYILKKIVNESYEIRMEKKCRKVKKREKDRGPGRYVTIFPLFFSYFFPIFPFLLLLLLFLLLHFFIAQLRLGHDWEWCRVKKYYKRGLEKKTGPKRRRFGLFLLKLKRAKTMSFWTRKVKKIKLGLSPAFKKSAESCTTQLSRIRLEADCDESDTKYLDSAWIGWTRMSRSIFRVNPVNSGKKFNRFSAKSPTTNLDFSEKSDIPLQKKTYETYEN